MLRYFSLSGRAAEAAALLTLTQLFLPGPVIVYYGEEITLASTALNPNSSKQYPRQRGMMRWDETTNNGFSSFVGTSFFANVAQNETEAVFSKQFSDGNSPLRTFKRLAELRAKDHVFQWGDFTYRTTGLHIYSRYIKGSMNPTDPV